MKWTRRKTDDGLTEYVSGRYLLRPDAYYAGHSDRPPRVRGWDVHIDGKCINVGYSTYTCTRLSRAKAICEEHAASVDAPSGRL